MTDLAAFAVAFGASLAYRWLRRRARRGTYYPPL
jgi:membrane protease YdiL (CAAX protease family)